MCVACRELVASWQKTENTAGQKVDKGQDEEEKDGDRVQSKHCRGQHVG